jgi:broad specificity phosphatase PhoE
VRFVLVHHGELEEDPLAYAAAGHDDPPLSAAGLGQARALADELRALGGRGNRHAAVLTSPLRAPQTTAALISAGLELPAPELRDELTTLTPELLPADGGLEAVQAIQDRAWSILEGLKESHEPDATIVLVTHELTIRALVCRALSMPLSEMRRFALDPGSMTVIEYRTQPRERTLLASLNETCHVEGIS